MSKASAAKKTSKKPAKRVAAARGSAKKSARPAKTSRKRDAAPALDVAARRRLLKMRDDSGDVIERVVQAWPAVKGLRVANVTPARLRALLVKVRRAQAKEDALRAKVEARLRALVDARMLAEDAAFRALLEVRAAVKLATRSDASVGTTFAFLADHLRGARAEAPAEPEPNT